MSSQCNKTVFNNYKGIVMVQFSYSAKRVIKIMLVGCMSFASVNNLAAQNVGIGNTNPAHKLDVSGRMRIRGGINDNFTAGLWLTGVNNDSTNNKLFVGMESDSSAGFYSELSSYGWFLVANGKEGRLGIRNRNPQYPLSFSDEGGDKLSLFREPNGNYYGMGIGNSTMQLMTPGTHAHLHFG